MDKAYLSRIVARFRRRGLVRARASPEHGRHVLLSLTEAGRGTFSKLDAGTRAQMDALLLPLGQDRRQRLAAAMREIRSVLAPDQTVRDDVRLRGLVPGDLGWIIHRQAVSPGTTPRARAPGSPNSGARLSARSFSSAATIPPSRSSVSNPPRADEASDAGLSTPASCALATSVIGG